MSKRGLIFNGSNVLSSVEQQNETTNSQCYCATHCPVKVPLRRFQQKLSGFPIWNQTSRNYIVLCAQRKDEYQHETKIDCGDDCQCFYELCNIFDVFINSRCICSISISVHTSLIDGNQDLKAYTFFFFITFGVHDPNCWYNNYFHKYDYY